MPRVSQQRILHTVGQMYDAATTGSPAEWLDVYKEIAGLVSSGPGVLTLFTPPKNTIDIVATTASPSSVKEYTEYFQFVSPFQDTLANLKPGECFSRIESCPDDVFENTELYQGHLRKQDIYQIEYHELCDLPDLKGGISFTRPKSNLNFTEHERQRIKFLLPHLQRAFFLHLTVSRAQVAHLQFAEALSRVSQCVIVLDRSARVVFLNSAAEKTIAEKDGLEVDRDLQLFASHRQENKAFRAALESIFADTLEEPSSSRGIVQLTRPSGLRPLQVMVLPFTAPGFRSYPSKPLAMILLYDPEYRGEPIESVLSQIYGLTPAEARLAAILARGHR